MDGDDGVSIDNGIHTEKGQCKYFLLRQWTCDSGARVVVDQIARQGTYNNGIGIGVGFVKAEGLL